MRTRILLVVVAICSFLSTPLFSGKLPVSGIYLSLPDQTVKCNVVSESIELSTSETLTYFWYSQNAIFQTQGSFAGKLLHGDYKSFYLSNQLKEQGQFDKGLKHGKWYTWSADGRLRECWTWKKGVLQGAHRVYNEKGQLIREENYKKGVLKGKPKSYKPAEAGPAAEPSKANSTKEEKRSKKSKKKAASDSTSLKTPMVQTGVERGKETAKPDNSAKKGLFKKKKPAATADVPAPQPAPAAATPAPVAKKEKKSLGQTIRSWFKKKEPTTANTTPNTTTP